MPFSNTHAHSLSPSLTLAHSPSPSLSADEKRQILMNPEVIAIDQDALGRAGDRLANYSSGAQVQMLITMEMRGE